MKLDKSIGRIAFQLIFDVNVWWYIIINDVQYDPNYAAVNFDRCTPNN